MTGGAEEIAKIERELDHLRERYAIFQRYGVWALWVWMALVLAFAGFTLESLIRGNLVGAIVPFIGLVIAAVAAFRHRGQRLIDVLSMPGFGTNAREVERIIAERETRVAELKGRMT
jgi:hypothetical protein